MAARYWVGGGSSSNWSATGNTNWSATSGGSNNASVPGSGDDVYFDGAGTNGNTANTVSATITVNSITYSSGYTQTTTINALLTVSTTIQLGTGNSTFAGTSGFSCATLSQISGGVSTITLKDGVQYTVTSSLSVWSAPSGSVTITSSSGTIKALLKLNNGSACTCNTNTTRIDASGGRSIATFSGTVTDCVNVVSYTDLKGVSGAV